MNFKRILIVLSIIIIAFPLISSASEISVIGIGGGGVFVHPLIDANNPSHLLTASDMGSLYYSENNGKTWHRSETKSRLTALHLASDGTVFAGGYGLYASTDGARSLNLIYPSGIKYSVSRMGTNEQLFLSDGYTNSLVTAISSYGESLCFSTHDWYGSIKVFSSSFTGGNLTLLYEEKTASSPSYGKHRLIADEFGIFFSNGSEIVKISDNNPIVFSGKNINAFSKIGSNYVFIDNFSRIISTTDFISFNDISSRNLLPASIEKHNTSYPVIWEYDHICGNDTSNLYIAFHSDVKGYKTIYGILKYNGTSFEQVLNSADTKREVLVYPSWSYHAYGPIEGICADKSNPNRLLMANIEAVYDITYSDNQTKITPLHSFASNGAFTSSGLDCQSSHTVRRNPFNHSHLIIPTSDMGLQYSFDNGLSWQKTSTGGDTLLSNCYDVYFDLKTPDKVYGIWSNAHSAPYELSHSDIPHYKGAFGISYDSGLTWDFSYSDGIPENSIPVRMSVFENGENLTISVATVNNGFFLSYDSGKTFFPINQGVTSHNGVIYGIDTLITPTDIYMLTSHHTADDICPSELCKFSVITGETTRYDLGEVIIARSLSYDGCSIYLNALPYYRYEWLKGINDGYWVNYGGGIYTISNNTLQLVCSAYDGITSSAFAPDGTMYAAGPYGTLYKAAGGTLLPVCENLFNQLKNICIYEHDIYITTRGGGTYRISNY